MQKSPFRHCTISQITLLGQQISVTIEPKRDSKGAKNNTQIGQSGHSWAKRINNGRKTYRNGSFGSLLRYEVGPKRAKNRPKSAKNVSFGSALRSEVWSKKSNLGQKEIQPEKINPAKKNLNPAKKKKFQPKRGNFWGSKLAHFGPLVA